MQRRLFKKRWPKRTDAADVSLKDHSLDATSLPSGTAIALPNRSLPLRKKRGPERSFGNGRRDHKRSIAAAKHNALRESWDVQFLKEFAGPFKALPFHRDL